MKCYYHKSDLDGHCSDAILHFCYKGIDSIGVDYSDKLDLENFEIGETVFVVDFSWPINDMIKLNKKVDLFWLDHHKTAIDDEEKSGYKDIKGLRKKDLAGCELTWQFLYPNKKMPTPVRLLGRYDRWDLEPKVLYFQYGMRAYGDTRWDSSDKMKKLWIKLFINYMDLVEKIIQNGKIIYNYIMQDNEKYAKGKAFETEIDGIKAIAINKGNTNSQLFDSVFDPEKHKIMIPFCWTPSIGKWTCSLYSKNFDVTPIAKKYGGGGHAKASGFTCEELPFKLKSIK